MQNLSGARKTGYPDFGVGASVEASTLFLAKVFNWMMIGLCVTGVTSYVFGVFGLSLALVRNFPLLIGLGIGELVLVFVLSSQIQTMSASFASAMFLIYSVLNGITLSPLFLKYISESITSTFFITAGMFGAMSLYGFVTKRDLTEFGSFLFMGLIGLIIATVANLFMQSSALYWVLTYIGVFIFLGLTAFDTQEIKKLGESGIMSQDESEIQRATILGALDLYLDFICLFQYLIRIFGSSDD